MRVAIDIRRAGDYGLGTYIRNIVNQLARIDDNSRYLLIGERRHLAEFDSLPDNFELLNMPTNLARLARIYTCLAVAQAPSGHSAHAVVSCAGNRSFAPVDYRARLE